MSTTERRHLVCIGNYRLTGNTLGKGHFARVEEAVHTLLNVKVAIKIVDLLKMNDKYMEQHLRREAVILAKLSHPCIIALYEVQETDTNYYLIEEMGAGGNLSTFTKNRRLDERRARSFCQQLTSALEHMHDRGVIHRDLKMDNILLDKPRENVKIADFGLSNEYTPNCFLNTHCGSPEYAAPELFVCNKKYGPEIDIWSLGVVFYAMILGKLPFQAPKRTNETHDENRNRLVSELKHGLGAKQLNELSKCHNFFKSIITKMLMPVARDRITVQQLLAYVNPTTKMRRPESFPAAPDETVYRCLETARMAHEFNIPVDDVRHQLRTQPLSALGGIYNIRRHHFQLGRMSSVTSMMVRATSTAATGKPTKHVNFKQPNVAVESALKIDAESPITVVQILSDSSTDNDADDLPALGRCKSQPSGQVSVRARSAIKATRSVLEGRKNAANVCAAVAGRQQSPYARRRQLSSGARSAMGDNAVAVATEQRSQRVATRVKRPSTCSHAPQANSAIRSPTPIRQGTAGVGHRAGEPNTSGGFAVRTATKRSGTPINVHPMRRMATSGNGHEGGEMVTTRMAARMSDGGGGGGISGAPMHTAMRAAVRKAAKAANGTTVAVSVASTAKAKPKPTDIKPNRISAQVRRTFDTVSRSFSKFMTPKRRPVRSDTANAATVGPSTTMATSMPASRAIKSAQMGAAAAATGPQTPVAILAGGKRSSGLLFWRRAKA